MTRTSWYVPSDRKPSRIYTLPTGALGLNDILKHYCVQCWSSAAWLIWRTKKTKTAETEDPSVLICPGWGRPIVGVRTYVSVNWSRNIPPLMEKRQTACEYPSKSMVLIHLKLLFSDSNLKREVKSAIIYPSIQSKHLWSFSKELWNTANTPDCTERAPMTANTHSCSP